jgi:predicted RNA-binding Zn-ribbon protein involved in translation (DUF1610 family)
MNKSPKTDPPDLLNPNADTLVVLVNDKNIDFHCPDCGKAGYFASESNRVRCRYRHPATNKLCSKAYLKTTIIRKLEAVHPDITKQLSDPVIVSKKRKTATPMKHVSVCDFLKHYHIYIILR